jgi:Domain of unknown function (DUF4265)
MADVELEKIVVNLPEPDLGVGGEGLWVKALGNDLYEVHNSPWHSREINYLDVVKAISPAEDKKPVFVSVERRGGHRTIQVILLENGQTVRDEILARLNELGGTYEGAHSKLFAIDFAPGVDWEPAKSYLEQLLAEDKAEYRWSAY